MPLVRSHPLNDSWTYDAYSPDTPVPEFGPGATFVELWHSKRNGTALPRWKDFPLEDFGPWYGWLALEELIPSETYDSVFRLWGNQLVEAFDVELTNRRFSEFLGQIYSEEEVEFWRWVCSTPYIVSSTGTVDWLDQNHRLHGRRYLDLSLPLADDGAAVDRYLSVTIAIGAESSQSIQHSVFGSKPRRA